MNLPGLHQLIAQARTRSADLARKARAPRTCPREAYECGVEADELAAEADKMTEHLKANEQLMEGILQLTNYLAKSPVQSRHRSIAITNLETAYARLLMENGMPEPARDFKPLPTPAPTNGEKKD